MPLMKKLDLHPGHVHTGRALAAAGFATDAKVHGVLHCVRGERIGPKLPGQSKAEAIGAAARHVLFITRGDVRGAHNAGVELATGPVVVAHLHSSENPAPVGPIKDGLDRRGPISRLVAEQAALVHAGRAHDLAGIEQRAGIEGVLDGFEGAHQALAEHL